MHMNISIYVLREGGVPDYVFAECSTLTSIAWRFQVYVSIL